METGSGRGRDRALSQVIGIVLLVGITVVLVGLTAVYITDFADQNREPAPQFSGKVEFNDTYSGEGQYLNITHDAGAPIDTDTIYVRVDGARVYSGGSTTGTATYDGNSIEEQAGDEFAATDTISLNRTAFVDGGGNDLTGSEYLDLRDATVRIIWETDDGQRTEIIYECSVEAPSCEAGPR